MAAKSHTKSQKRHPQQHPQHRQPQQRRGSAARPRTAATAVSPATSSYDARNRTFYADDHEAIAALARFGGNVLGLRAAAPMPTEEQTLIDNAVLTVGRTRLVLVDDLIAEGLTRPLPNWISVMELGHYRRAPGNGHAQRTMDLDVRGERQVPNRDRVVIPIFATHDDFSFGAREIAASERVGTPLETDVVEDATINVNEAIEDQAWNGAGFSVAGNTAPGVLSSANTFDLTGTNPAWNHAAKTGQEIVNDILGMIAQARAARKYGPYNFYIPGDWGTVLNRNFSDGVTTFDQTILERLLKIQAGGRAIRIREADMLTDKIAMIQMTRDVIDVVVGQTPRALSWTSNNGFRRFHTVLGCMVTRIKEDYDSAQGIVIGQL